MKIAVVGCGQIADAHIGEVLKIPGCTVASVCDLDYSMAEQAAARFQISGVYTDLDRMLATISPGSSRTTSRSRS